MKTIVKKLLSVLVVLAILLVPMTVAAELGDSEEPWQLTASDPMFPSRPMSVCVEPGETQWVQAADMNGLVTVGYATGEYMIMYGRMPVYPETESGDYTAELQLQGYDIFSIYNPGETAVTVYMTLTAAGPVEIPVGTWDNPEVIETSGAYAATIEEGTDGYFYTWVAPAYGKVTVKMEDEAGWQYVVSKTPADENDWAGYYNGDWHMYNDDEVVASEELIVYAGETVNVQVNTFDPENQWTAPAGNVNWSFTYESVAAFIVGDAIAGVGQEFDVAISLDNNPGIVSLKLDVAYDAEKFEIVKVTDGDFAASTESAGETVGNYNYGELTVCPFTINWVDALAEENVTTNGVIATITFKVKDTAVCGDASEITVTYDAENVFDKDLNNVEIGVLNGEVTIDHTLTYIDEIPATCTEPGVMGHDKCEVCGKLFNWGMEITEEDLVQDPYHERSFVEEVPATETETGIKEHYVCPCGTLWVFDWDTFEFVAVTEEELIIPMLPTFTYGDVNGDGEINNRDLALLMQYLNEWDVELNLDAADVNVDGEVNNRDYALLMQFTNEWDVTIGK